MKPKHLIVLAGILGVLLVVGYLARRPQEARPITAEVGYVKLMPDSVVPEAVTAIAFAQGGETVVKLVKKKGDWVIQTEWDAPAKEEKVEKLLADLKDAMGTVASENEELHETYQVSEDKGIHVRLYTHTPDKPAFELVLGKNKGYEYTFVRLAGQKKVYESTKDVLGHFNVYGDDRKPKYKPWLDKVVLKADKDEMTRVEVRYPDHTLVFAREAKEKTDDEEGGAEADPGKTEGETLGDWQLVSGGPGVSVKKDKLKDYIGDIAEIEARNVVAPGKKKELGLDTPSFRLTVQLKEEERKALLGAGNPDSAEQTHVMVPGSDLIFGMAPWTFEKIFPKGKKLFDLKTPTVDKKQVRSLVLKRGKAVVKLERKDADADWTLVEPQTGFPLDESQAKQMGEKLAEWEAEDFADPDGLVSYKLNMPVCELTVGLAEGEPRRFLLGAEHPAQDGSYVAEVPEKAPERVYVMAKRDVKKVFPDVARLLDLSSVLDVKADAIQSVRVAQPGEAAFVLARREKPAPEKEGGGEKKEAAEAEDAQEQDEDEGAQDGEAAADDGAEEAEAAEWVWVLTQEGTDLPLAQDKAEAFVKRLADLEAEDVLLNEAAAEAFPEKETAVCVVKHEGGEIALKIGKAVKDRGRALEASNRKSAVLIKTETADKLLVSPSDLAPPKPEPAEAEGDAGERQGLEAGSRAGEPKKPAPAKDARDPADK